MFSNICSSVFIEQCSKLQAFIRVDIKTSNANLVVSAHISLCTSCPKVSGHLETYHHTIRNQNLYNSKYKPSRMDVITLSNFHALAAIVSRQDAYVNIFHISR